MISAPHFLSRPLRLLCSLGLPAISSRFSTSCSNESLPIESRHQPGRRRTQSSTHMNPGAHQHRRRRRFAWSLSDLGHAVVTPDIPNSFATTSVSRRPPLSPPTSVASQPPPAAPPVAQFSAPSSLAFSPSAPFSRASPFPPAPPPLWSIKHHDASWPRLPHYLPLATRNFCASVLALVNFASQMTTRKRGVCARACIVPATARHHSAPCCHAPAPHHPGPAPHQCTSRPYTPPSPRREPLPPTPHPHYTLRNQVAGASAASGPAAE